MPSVANTAVWNEKLAALSAYELFVANCRIIAPSQCNAGQINKNTPQLIIERHTQPRPIGK